jgi:hypothetical protein
LALLVGEGIELVYQAFRMDLMSSSTYDPLSGAGIYLVNQSLQADLQRLLCDSNSA